MEKELLQSILTGKIEKLNMVDKSNFIKYAILLTPEELLQAITNEENDLNVHNRLRLCEIMFEKTGVYNEDGYSVQCLEAVQTLIKKLEFEKQSDCYITWVQKCGSSCGDKPLGDEELDAIESLCKDAKELYERTDVSNAAWYHILLLYTECMYLPLPKDEMIEDFCIRTRAYRDGAKGKALLAREADKFGRLYILYDVVSPEKTMLFTLIKEVIHSRKSPKKMYEDFEALYKKELFYFEGKVNSRSLILKEMVRVLHLLPSEMNYKVTSLISCIDMITAHEGIGENSISVLTNELNDALDVIFPASGSKQNTVSSLLAVVEKVNPMHENIEKNLCSKISRTITSITDAEQKRWVLLGYIKVLSQSVRLDARHSHIEKMLEIECMIPLPKDMGALYKNTRARYFNFIHGLETNHNIDDLLETVIAMVLHKEDLVYDFLELYRITKGKSVRCLVTKAIREIEDDDTRTTILGKIAENQ